MTDKRDTRSSKGRKFPARAVFMMFLNNGKGARLDQIVDVVFETKQQYVIRAITETRMAGSKLPLQPGKRGNVFKDSIMFINEGETHEKNV